MPKDFAGRGGGARKTKRRAAPRKTSPSKRVLFHGPSFSAGALVGAAIVILAAFAPELMQTESREEVARTSPDDYLVIAASHQFARFGEQGLDALTAVILLHARSGRPDAAVPTAPA